MGGKRLMIPLEIQEEINEIGLHPGDECEFDPQFVERFIAFYWRNWADVNQNNKDDDKKETIGFIGILSLLLSLVQKLRFKIDQEAYLKIAGDFGLPRDLSLSIIEHLFSTRNLYIKRLAEDQGQESKQV
ncbi:MAG: hypothetical protein AB1656_05015 [Candidatus Omnitrophota bacterium]